MTSTAEKFDLEYMAQLFDRLEECGEELANQDNEMCPINRICDSVLYFNQNEQTKQVYQRLIDRRITSLIDRPKITKDIAQYLFSHKPSLCVTIKAAPELEDESHKSVNSVYICSPSSTQNDRAALALKSTLLWLIALHSNYEAAPIDSWSHNRSKNSCWFFERGPIVRWIDSERGTFPMIGAVDYIIDKKTLELYHEPPKVKVNNYHEIYEGRIQRGLQSNILLYSGFFRNFLGMEVDIKDDSS